MVGLFFMSFKLLLENWKKFLSEEKIPDKFTNKIKGGKADNMKPTDFPPEKLKKGYKFEKEHTHDPDIPWEIAADHEAEFTEYYDELEKMEKKLKKRSKNKKLNEKKLFVLVGPPGVGKSTWIKNNFNLSECYIVSRDNIVENLFKEGQVDSKKIKFLFLEQLNNAKFSNKDIILDLPNLSAKTRKNMIDKLNLDENYKKIAVVFNFEGYENLLLKNIERRRKETNKNICLESFNQLISIYNPVSKNENFDEILTVDNIPIFKTLKD